MIPEPQRTYVLELLNALGAAANDFIVVGAQAMKFVHEGARATKDIDLILDVVRLRGGKPSVRQRLKELGYAVVEGAHNFQFEKPIPNNNERMRIEFMAPEELKRDKDFRVDVEDGVHARACTGGRIAIAESKVHTLTGSLPGGAPFRGSIRVTEPHALVMLKLLALHDRYRNIRGPEEAEHDREEARTHAADIVAIVTAQTDQRRFRDHFENQFQIDPALGIRVLSILGDCFRENTSAGLLVYEEFLVADKPLDPKVRRQTTQEVERAHKIMLSLLPPQAFYDLIAAMGDSCDIEQNFPLVKEFLTNLERTGIGINDDVSVELLPAESFGGAYSGLDKLTASASEALKALSKSEMQLVRCHLQNSAERLKELPELVQQFPHALK